MINKTALVCVLAFWPECSQKAPGRLPRALLEGPRSAPRRPPKGRPSGGPAGALCRQCRRPRPRYLKRGSLALWVQSLPSQRSGNIS